MPFVLGFTPKNININKDSADVKNLTKVILNIPSLPHCGATAEVRARPDGQVALIKFELRGIAVVDDESVNLAHSIVEKSLSDENMPFYVSSLERTQVFPNEIVFRHERLKPGKSKNALSIAHLELDVPEEFCCPLSGDIMDTPVYDIRSSGVKYDEDHLMYWLNKSNPKLNPHTKVPLSEIFLEVDYALKARICSYVKTTLESSKKEILHKTLLKYGIETSEDKGSINEGWLKCMTTEEVESDLFIFLKSGANVNYQDASNNQTALHIVLAKRNFQVAVDLIHAGAQINIEDAQGVTAFDLIKSYPIKEDKERLLFTCQHVKLITVSGGAITLTSVRKPVPAKPTVCDGEMKFSTPVSQRFGSPVTANGDAYSMFTRKIETLLKNDEKPGELDGFKKSIDSGNFEQALRRACNFSDIKRIMPFVEALLFSKDILRFDINSKNKETFTALHYAAIQAEKCKDRSIYDLLVANGARDNIPDVQGKTAKEYLDVTPGAHHKK